MSDIFISYSSKDRARAKVLAGALEHQGWSVWWDRKIPPGRQFSQVIKEAMDEARCIIVLWSKESVKSEWVQNEAAEGARRKILVPALIDDVEIPFEFRRIQAARLIDWEGRSPHPEFDILLEALCAILGQPLLPQRDSEVPSRDVLDHSKLTGLETEKGGSMSQKTKVLAAICIVALIAFVSIGVFLKDRQPKAGTVVTNSIGMKLVYIPAGEFMMVGSSEEEGSHEVRISEGFRMSQTEVTQGQYKKVIGEHPWSGKDNVKEHDDNPAVYVSYADAVRFCTELGKLEGKTYRLPTEAEWEYACRAGTKTEFSFGDDRALLKEYAWFLENAGKLGQEYGHQVGQKKPNPWGLYDMHGNVWEWCSDWYGEGEDARTLRGGSWHSRWHYVRCSSRYPEYASTKNGLDGFRVVCSQP